MKLFGIVRFLTRSILSTHPSKYIFHLLRKAEIPLSVFRQQAESGEGEGGARSTTKRSHRDAFLRPGRCFGDDDAVRFGWEFWWEDVGGR